MRGQLPGGTEQRFKLAADATLQRGDLRLASASSLVDGTLAARCAEIIGRRAQVREPQSTDDPGHWSGRYARSATLAAVSRRCARYPHRRAASSRTACCSRTAGMTLEAEGCEAPVGSRCFVVDHDGRTAETEVVGFSGGSLLLVATDEIGDVMPGARVIPGGRGVRGARGARRCWAACSTAPASRSTARGRCAARIASDSTPRTTNPLDRKPIREPLDVGVRSINALLTVGRGQRLGLFAGSGVGKSVLLGMMTRFTSADVIVVGLIGERGREVQDFVVAVPHTARRASAR